MWVSWRPGCNCSGCAARSFPIPQIGCRLWQWGSSHLCPPGRSHLSALQGRVVIIRVFIGLSSPTVLAVIAWKCKTGQVTTHHGLPTGPLSHLKPADKCILTFLSAHSLLPLASRNLYNHALIGFLLFPQLMCEGAKLYNMQEVRPGDWQRSFLN